VSFKSGARQRSTSAPDIPLPNESNWTIVDHNFGLGGRAVSAESVKKRWLSNSKFGEFTLYPSDRDLIDPSLIIFKRVSSNPKSRRPAQRFALYQSGMSVDRYVSLVENLGDPRRVALEDILWDLNHEYIELRAFGKIWSPERAKAEKLERRARERGPASERRSLEGSDLRDPRGAAAVWTIAEAKAKLSEILRLAREGQPQTIGTESPCVVLSAAQFARDFQAEHLGRFLIEGAPRGPAIELPQRGNDRSFAFDVDVVGP
jgi:prevent-host-death family protein